MSFSHTPEPLSGEGFVMSTKRLRSRPTRRLFFLGRLFWLIADIVQWIKRNHRFSARLRTTGALKHSAQRRAIASQYAESNGWLGFSYTEVYARANGIAADP